MGRDGRIYRLSYVNLPDKTQSYDKIFKSLIQLVAWVEKAHPEYTSYQIIVVRRG